MQGVIKKDWGETRRIFRDRGVEIWHASIRRGGKSSVHRHNFNGNHFYVVSGELVIVYDDDIHRLFPGTTDAVPHQHWHSFEALTDVELIETYTVIGDYQNLGPIADIDRKEPANVEGNPV